MAKLENPKKYDVEMDRTVVMSGVPGSLIIAACKARKTITARAFCRERGFILAKSYEPIRNFPQFAPYVSDTTLEEAETNPNPDAECYLLKENVQNGPFTPAQIRSMWNAGSITSDTLFFHGELEDWRPVKRFCQNSKWQFSQTSESKLLKQVVSEQQKATSQLSSLRWAFVGVFVIPFILYQCNKH